MTGWAVLIYVVWLIFLIVGACLMGLSNPQQFSTPGYSVGFALIIVDAAFILVAIVIAFAICCCPSCIYKSENTETMVKK